MFEFGFDRDGQATSLRDESVSLLERNLFTQRLRVRNTGFVFGQRLVTFTPNLTLGFAQDKLATGGESETLASKLLAYDLSAIVFPDKPYNLKLFTSKSDTFMPLRFGGGTEVDVSNRGATFNLTGSILRSVFAYWERRLQVRSTGIGSKDRHEFRKNLSYRGTGAWDRNNLSLLLEFEDVDDKIFPDFSFASRNADIYHRYSPSTKRHLTSSFRQSRRDGRLQEELTYLEERLQLQFDEGFSGQFSYRYRDREAGDREAVEHRVSAAVDHQLYDSLRTSGLIEAGWQDRDDGEQTGMGARLAVGYTKILRWRARMTADWVLRYEQRADRSETGERQVVGEEHVARLGLPLPLEQPHVIEGSIVVTDAGARTIFVPGVDYDVRTVGIITEVTPSVDGAIGEGEPLRVDYRVLSPRAVRSELRQQRFGFGLQRGILAASYVYDKSTAATIEGDDEGLLNGDTERHLGAVGINWSNARLTVGISNRYRREVQPQLDYALWGFSQLVRFKLNSHYVLNLDAVEEFTDFSIPDRRTRRISGRSTLQWAVFPGLRVSALAALRLWADTLSVNETFFEAGARADWRFPSFTVRTALTQQYRWRGDTGYDGLRFTLRASRAF